MILQKKHIINIALIIGLLLVVSAAGLALYSYQQRQVNNDAARVAVAKLQAVASSNDMTAKAKAFVEQSRILQYSFWQISSDKKKEVRAALTSLILQDAPAMMTNLYQSDSPSAKILIPYLKVMINDEEFTDIGHLLIKLKYGNDPSKTDGQFLSETKKDKHGKEYFANQRNLGMVYGAIVVSIEQAAASDKERGHIASNILRGIAKLLPEDKFKNVTQNGSRNISPQHYADMIDKNENQWSDSLRRFATVRDENGEKDILAGEYEFNLASDHIINAYRKSQ